MEHLVIHEVFNGEAGDVWVVEDTANHDGVVGRVVVTEQPARLMVTPG